MGSICQNGQVLACGQTRQRKVKGAKCLPVETGREQAAPQAHGTQHTFFWKIPKNKHFKHVPNFSANLFPGNFFPNPGSGSKLGNTLTQPQHKKIEKNFFSKKLFSPKISKKPGPLAGRTRTHKKSLFALTHITTPKKLSAGPQKSLKPLESDCRTPPGVEYPVFGSKMRVFSVLSPPVTVVTVL